MSDQSPSQAVLGAPHLIFFVVAAAAPLGFAVGAIPIGIGRGGIGLPLAFVVTAMLLAVFAVGYVAMAAHVRKVGGLYEFVSAGLGRTMGVGAAFVALGAYASASTGAVGAFAVFAGSVANDWMGWNLHWSVWAASVVALMGIMGVCRIDLNAKVLGLVILLEVVLLLVLAIAIIIQGGDGELSLTPMAPSTLMSGHAGAIFAVTIAAFAGFEATVIYSSETRGGWRTIRRATIGAIVLIAALHWLVSWSLIAAYGEDKVMNIANADPVALFFNAAYQYGGGWLVMAFQLVAVASWFASILAFHNATARYLASMALDGIAPSRLAELHPRFESPWRASLAHTGFTAIVVAGFLLASGDPYMDLYIFASTPAVIGIPLLELLAAVAMLAYFARNPHGYSIFVRQIAPGVSALALLIVVGLIVTQVDIFTARSGWVNVVFPLITAATLIVGIAVGLRQASRSSMDPAQGAGAT